MNPLLFHPAWIEIDLAQLARNVAAVRDFIRPALLCFPVKANAYGHGLVAVAKTAASSGVDYLAVAHLREAVELRQAGVTLPLLLLGAVHEEQLDLLLDYEIECTLSSVFKARLVAERCQKRRRSCRVHLEVDTGMQRTGVRPSSAQELLDYVASEKSLELVGVYSHLATADELQHPFTSSQIELFSTLINSPAFANKPVIRHLLSSSGLRFPGKYFEMVRPSLLLLGYCPAHLPPPLQVVKPCFALKAKLSYFKVVPEGTGISYGHRYITHKQTRIVTVPVGYGDGYCRRLSSKGHVLIRGKRYPIAGTICMDQFMVDIGQDEAYVGDEVVLIGRQGIEAITIQEIAGLCDTIPYEILCQFNDRIPRRYLG